MMNADHTRTDLGRSTHLRQLGTTILATAVMLLGALSANGAEVTKNKANGDKTLVAWVSPANLTQQGGSALTIQSGDRFDAIVFGERARGKWMAGSDSFQRTQGDQAANAAETAKPDALVQIAIVYEGNEVRLYRNGEAYAAYKTQNVDLLNIENHIAVFGLRHVGAGTGTPLAGAIEDARIYGRALTPQEIQSLRPNAASDIKPLAWWDFEGDAVKDRAGHFTHHAAVGGTKVKDGRLVLDGTGYLVVARSEADAKQATLNAPPPRPSGRTNPRRRRGRISRPPTG